MIDIESLGSDGYRIDGSDIAATSFVEITSPGPGVKTGDPVSIANIGDLNGDGRDDLATGLADASHNGVSGSGSVYVVYGQATATPIDLDDLGNSGFRVDGPSTVAGLGGRRARNERGPP